MKILAALALCLVSTTGLAGTRILSERDLQKVGTIPFGPDAQTRLMGTHVVLGLYHGGTVVADYPCSDLCPERTIRVISIIPPEGKTCTDVDGVKTPVVVPLGIGLGEEKRCVPRPLITFPLH
jgi:hypothetical protein